MFGIGELPPGSTPIPWHQLGVLMAVRLSEPVNYALIFPFINQQIVEVTEIAPESVGFYSGLVEGVFALAQFSCVFWWGSLSDRIGRRPVILCGVAGVALSGALFGLSRSLGMMMFARSLAGMLSGNVAVIKASLGEMTDETNQAVAFPLYGLCWLTGNILGNLLGGYTSHPVETYPAWFGGSRFLAKYPYFLPCGIASGLSVLGWIFAYFFLKESLVKTGPSAYELMRENGDEAESHELLGSASMPVSSYPVSARTLPLRSHMRSPSTVWAAIRSASTSLSHSPAPSKEAWPAGRLLSLPAIQRVILSCFSLNVTQGAWTGVYLLVCYSPIKDGGLGLIPSQIGLTLACTGAWSLIFQLLFLPALQIRLGVKRLYRMLCAGYVVLFVLLPTVNWLAVVTDSTSSPAGAQLSWIVWALLYFALFLSVPILSTGSIVLILVNASSPHPSALGKLNGLTTMAGSLAYAIGPAAASALFAVSHSSAASEPSKTGGSSQKLLGGHLWWVLLVAIAVANILLSATLGDVGVGRKSSLCTIDEDDERTLGGEDDEVLKLERRGESSRSSTPSGRRW